MQTNLELETNLETPPGSIFVCYRREDSRHATTRICERLHPVFSRDAVFRDVDSVRGGEDFPESIRKRLENCRVVLVVIGDHWLHARNERRARRLDDPNDWVRIEVELALARRATRVIPILLDDAEMPAAAVLPVRMRGLANRQVLPVRDADFDGDIERLIKHLQQVLAEPEPAPDPPKTPPPGPRLLPWIIGFAVLCLSIALLIGLVDAQRQKGMAVTSISETVHQAEMARFELEKRANETALQKERAEHGFREKAQQAEKLRFQLEEQANETARQKEIAEQGFREKTQQAEKLILALSERANEATRQKETAEKLRLEQEERANEATRQKVFSEKARVEKEQQAIALQKQLEAEKAKPPKVEVVEKVVEVPAPQPPFNGSPFSLF